jgi:integrase
MARTVIPLNDTQLKNAKPKNKAYTLSDGQGLHLLIKPSGIKLWEFFYKSPITLKRRKTSFSNYPKVTLKEARNKRSEYQTLLNNNIDPIEQNKKNREDIKIVNIKKANTFLKVSQEWLKKYESEVSENYHKKLERALELYVYPFIKSKAIDEVTRLDIIAILEYLRDKELLETANRTLMILNKIFMYAVTYEYIPHNIIADIDKKVILGKIVKKNYPTFTKDKDIKALLLSIDDYQGDYTTKKALQMLPYVFVRSFNIRHCEWSEIDLKAKIWVIPSNKMKTKTEFILPLPHQVIKILKEVKEFSGSGKYVFPSFRAKDKPMSDNTLISAIRRMGYTKDEFVPHGFRAMFSTIAYEKANNKDGHNYTGEVIEALLAHKEPNKVKGAYNRAKYIEPMRGLICWYADYLDGVKNG